MQTLVPNSGKSSKVAVKTLLVAACAAGLMLATPFDAAQARKGHRHGGSDKETEYRNPFQPGVKLHQTPGHWERSRGGGLKWVGPGSPKGKSDPGVRNHGAKVREHRSRDDDWGASGGVTVKDSVTGKRGFCKSSWWQLRC